jgi:hypothetical protein
MVNYFDTDHNCSCQPTLQKISIIGSARRKIGLDLDRNGRLMKTLDRSGSDDPKKMDRIG